MCLCYLFIYWVVVLRHGGEPVSWSVSWVIHSLFICYTHLHYRQTCFSYWSTIPLSSSTYSRHFILPASGMRFLRSPPSPLTQTRPWASVMPCHTLSCPTGQTAPGDLQAPVALSATWWWKPTTHPLLPPLWTPGPRAWSSWTSGPWVRLEGEPYWAPLHW